MRKLAVVLVFVIPSLAATIGPARPPSVTVLRHDAPRLFPTRVDLLDLAGPREVVPTTTTTTVPPPPPESPPPAPEPVAAPNPAPEAAAAPVSDSGGIWACIRQHESGDDYAEDTGNGYYGAVQWLPSTWDAAATGAGYGAYANGRADLAPPAVQDAVAVYWQSVAGWSQWGTAYGCGA